MRFGPDTVPRRRSGTEAARFGRDFVVLDGAGRMLRGLNETGARAWELVDGARSVREIADRISSELGLAGARVLEDLIAFFRRLSERELVEFVGVPR